jgi:hypothetical protein
MIKDFLLNRGKPSVPFEEIKNYIEFTHAPMAMGNGAISTWMRRFALNHVVFDTAWDCCLYRPLSGLVTIPEHDVGGWDGFNDIVKDEDYLATIRPNEVHLVEKLFYAQPQFVQIDDERTIFASGSPGTLRLFDFVRRPEAMSREDFERRLEDDGAWAAAQPQYRQAVAQRVHSLVGVGAPPIGAALEPFDAVVEAWVADGTLLATLVDEQKQRRAAFVDPERSISAMTRQHIIRG